MAWSWSSDKQTIAVAFPTCLAILPGMSLLHPATPYVEQSSARVTITDIDMTIGAMCRFMIKWAIASIPAAIILFIIVAILSFIVQAMR